MRKLLLSNKIINCKNDQQIFYVIEA